MNFKGKVTCSIVSNIITMQKYSLKNYIDCDVYLVHKYYINHCHKMLPKSIMLSYANKTCLTQHYEYFIYFFNTHLRNSYAKDGLCRAMLSPLSKMQKEGQACLALPYFQFYPPLGIITLYIFKSHLLRRIQIQFDVQTYYQRTL